PLYGPRRRCQCPMLDTALLALVDLALGDAAVEGEVAVARQAGGGVGEDLAGAGGVVPEQVDDHRGQGLGGGDVGERGIGDRVVGGVAGAAGAAHLGVRDWGELAVMCHVGRGGSMEVVVSWLGGVDASGDMLDVDGCGV